MPHNSTSLICLSCALEQLSYYLSNKPLRVTLPTTKTTLQKPTEKSHMRLHCTSAAAEAQSQPTIKHGSYVPNPKYVLIPCRFWKCIALTLEKWQKKRKGQHVFLKMLEAAINVHYWMVFAARLLPQAVLGPDKPECSLRDETRSKKSSQSLSLQVHSGSWWWHRWAYQHQFNFCHLGYGIKFREILVST